jgi:hypothetical protein
MGMENRPGCIPFGSLVETKKPFLDISYDFLVSRMEVVAGIKQNCLSYFCISDHHKKSTGQVY